MNTYEKIEENHKRMNEKFAPLRGKRVELWDKTKWEYSSCNDLGIPYFKKVVNGKTQKTEYVLPFCARKWGEDALKSGQVR